MAIQLPPWRKIATPLTSNTRPVVVGSTWVEIVRTPCAAVTEWTSEGVVGVGGTSACSNARKAVHQHAATVTGVVVVAAAAVATVVVIADFARAGGGSGVTGGRGHGEESAVGRQLDAATFEYDDE